MRKYKSAYENCNFAKPSDQESQTVKRKISIYSLIYCAAHLLSCSNGSDERISLASELAAQERKLSCEIDSLRHAVDSIWDDFNDSLSSGFPSTTSPYIRSKMLEMRNGELLRMFQTYDSLDSGIRSLLESTEERDRKIAEELDSLGAIGELIEQKKMQLFMELEKKEKAILEEVRENYEMILKTECQR